MVRYKGKDQIEFGYKNYTEALYGNSPGATPTTLFRAGHVQELTPLYDPELSRVFVLRGEEAEAGRAVSLTRRKENVGLRIKWLQGHCAQYWIDRMLVEGENFFAEAIIKKGADEVYLYWTGLKLDVLTIRGSVGEDVVFEADLLGKTFDSKDSTIHSYGAALGLPDEWEDFYVQTSLNDADWTTIPDVTDWDFRIDNRLKPNFVFNAAGAKTVTTLEEMEQIQTARLTVNFTSNTFLDYLVDQTELYLKLVMPNSNWIKFNKGKFSLVEPILKPEDLIACRIEFEGRYLTTSWD